jgi:hypothetical protein
MPWDCDLEGVYFTYRSMDPSIIFCVEFCMESMLHLKMLFYSSLLKMWREEDEDVGDTTPANESTIRFRIA